jgi:isoleucyl-tRNA synthetase
MASLLRMRSTVLGLLEEARGKKCVILILLGLYSTRLKANIRQLSSSTEAEVDIILPNIGNDLISLIMREGMFLRIRWSTRIHRFHFIESFLKTLFIVSDVAILNEGSLETSPLPWFHTNSMHLPGETVVPPSPHMSKGPFPGSEAHIGVRVRPARLTKCPRCWTYTRPHGDVLCPRCADVLSTSW